MKTNSLYNTKSIADAVNRKNMGQYGITIIATYGKPPNDRRININGILKEAIGLNTEANWTTLPLANIIQDIMASNPLLKTLDNLVEAGNQLAGSSFVNTGIFSKLFYKNSGRLGISPSFRVFDYNGDGLCTRVATVLASLCIPTVGNSLDLKEPMDRVEELFQQGAGLVKYTPKSAMEKQVVKTALAAKNEIASSQANWPLYVDFNLKIETRENLAIGTDGNISQMTLGKSLQTSRVSISGSNRVAQG